MTAPDIIKIAQSYSAQTTAVHALFGSRITTNLPAAPVMPCAVVDLDDSTPRDSRTHWTWEYTLDVDVYAANENAARDAAFLLLAAWLDSPGYLHRLGTIVDAEHIAGPSHVPDSVTTPPRERFTFSVLLAAHP